jgi:hypothetical protein
MVLRSCCSTNPNGPARRRIIYSLSLEQEWGFRYKWWHEITRRQSDERDEVAARFGFCNPLAGHA